LSNCSLIIGETWRLKGLSELETRILELLSSEKDPEKLMADILRVLMLYNGVLWISELYREVPMFHGTLGEERVKNKEDINDAVSKLVEMKIVQIEERLKGSFASEGFIREQLVYVTDQSFILKIVSKDSKFRKFIAERERIFREILGKKK